MALLLSLTANLVRIPVISSGGRSLPILVNDVGVGIVLAVALIAALASRSLRLDSVTIAALVFATIGAGSALAAARTYGLGTFQLIASLSYLVRWLFYFGLYVVVVNHVRERDIVSVWKAVETMLLLFVGFGIIQSIFLPDFALMVYADARSYYDWDPQGHRLVSTVLEPNIAAAMIMVGVLVHLSLLAAGERVTPWKLGMLFAGLVLTLSRSGVAGLLVGGLVILAMTGLNKRLLLWTLGLSLLVAALLPVLLPFAAGYAKFDLSGGSAAARAISLTRALELFLAHPWFGIGFNTFGYVQEARGFERFGGAAYSSEGGLLFVAVMTGTVGLMVFLAMIWLVVHRCRRVWLLPQATPMERGLCVGAVAATAAVLVHSVFVNSLFATFVMQPLWVLWGLTFVAASAAGRRSPVR